MDASTPALVVSATRATWFATHASHPNVVRVLGVHHTSAGPRLMIEQIPGRDLGALIDAAFPERLPLPELLAVARDACRGLHYLHELRDAKGTAVRLVHGTLAPALVTIGFDGVGRVAGLERLCATRGAPLPDPAYAAPEQRREDAAVDRRADVFALGAVLLRAATGLALRDGAFPVPTSQAVPYVPQSIEDVLRKALAPDPAKRHPTAEHLRAALERCVIDEALTAAPDRVALMVSRYLPDVPAPRDVPPRPDHSLWAGGGAPRWMPGDPTAPPPVDGASAFDVISVSVPPPVAAPLAGPTRSPVPAAAPVAPTMTVAALVDDDATAIAAVPMAPAPPPPRPPPGPSAPPPMAGAPMIAAPMPGAPMPGAPVPPALQFVGLPAPPPRRSLLRDPLFLVGVGLVLFFATLLITYVASG